MAFCAFFSRKSLFLAFLLAICIANACAQAQIGQPRNLITIIPGKKVSFAPSPQIRLISSPSEEYQYMQKPVGQRGAARAAHFVSSNSNSAPVNQQQLPLYRDEGSISKYQTAESSARGYNSGGYSPAQYNFPPAQSYPSESQGYDANPIRAAVVSRHQISYYDVPSTSEPIQPTTIEVGAGQIPINLIFRSASSNLNIQQVHDGAKGTTQETESVDEPHLLKHTVTKPIFQHVYEMIVPMRYIKQEIHPVQEMISSIIHREKGKEYGTKEDYSEYPAAKYQAENPIVEPAIPQVQTPEYQSSSQVATIAKAKHRAENTYQPVDPEPEVGIKPAASLEQERLIDQINHDYLAASSNALLSSVYGASAATMANPRILPQHFNQYTAIDADLVNQYLPLVYEVMNSMESDQQEDETSSSTDSTSTK